MKKRNATSIFVLAAACFFLAANIALAEGVVAPTASKAGNEAATAALFNGMTRVRDEVVNMKAELDACMDFVNAAGGQSIPGGYTIQPGQCPGVDQSVAELKKQQAALNDRKANKGHTHNRLSKKQEERVNELIAGAIMTLQLPPKDAQVKLGEIQTDLSGEIASLRKEMEEIKAEQKRQGKKLTELETAQAGLDQAQKDLKAALEERGIQVERQEIKVNEHGQEIAAIKKQLEEKSAEAAKLVALGNKLDTATADSAQLSQLRTDVDELKKSVRGLVQQLDQLIANQAKTDRRQDKRTEEVAAAKTNYGRGSVGASFFAMPSLIAGGLFGEYEAPRLGQGLVILGIGGILGVSFDEEALLTYGIRAKLAFAVWQGLQLGVTGFGVTAGFSIKENYGAGLGPIIRYDFPVGDGLTVFVDAFCGYVYRGYKKDIPAPDPLPGIRQVTPAEEWVYKDGFGGGLDIGLGF